MNHRSHPASSHHKHERTDMKNLPHSKSTVHLGVDVAKSELVLDCVGAIHRFTNDAKGIKALLKATSKTSGIPHLVCEATGGYERDLVAAALQTNVLISVMPPHRVRNFAKSLGRMAKSDPIDAAMISRYGASATPKPLQAK